MIYRSCLGCVNADHQCDARDALRNNLKGLMITSVKWKCRKRVDRFNVGDPVWAETVASTQHLDDHGYPYRGEFPALVIKRTGAKCLVFIKNGSPDRNDDELIFEPTGNGFCKISLSRIAARDGDRQEICRSCSWPAFMGHQSGYICNPAGIVA